MIRHIPDAGYTSIFSYFTDCNQIHLVSNEALPTDLTGSLLVHELVAGDFSINHTPPSGTGSRLTIAAQDAVDVAFDGTSKHAVLAYDDGVNPAEIRFVTPCSERVLSASLGDKVNLGEFYLQIAAPIAP